MYEQALDSGRTSFVSGRDHVVRERLEEDAALD